MRLAIDVSWGVRSYETSEKSAHLSKIQTGLRSAARIRGEVDDKINTELRVAPRTKSEQSKSSTK